MSYEAALHRPKPPSTSAAAAPPAWPAPAHAARLAVAAALVAAGWAVAQGTLYTSRSALGYALGVVGGALTLVLLLYPLRKHLRVLGALGPLRYWFRLHMMCGILGPLLILFHSTFRVRSLNAAVALGCMVLVTVSGLVGRFIYRRIHHGLYGSRATLEELQRELTARLTALEPLVEWIPAVRREVARFSAGAEASPAGRKRGTGHVLALGWERHLVARRIRRVIETARADRARRGASRADLAALLRTIDATLSAAQRTAQFRTYERLFSLWHVLHVPIVYMLAVSALAHVVAVHMY